MSMKRWGVAVGLVAVVACGGAAALAKDWPGDPNPSICVHKEERRPIDLVICLDTSGSMTGLIDSARGRLWEIVSSLSKAKPTPRLRVGLLTYGSPRVSSASQGWVVRQSNLTSDLDAIYAKMMALSTDGGDEFVGWVVNDAVRSMDWSDDPRALKIIFVAGNESADQASEVFNFRSVAESARGRGIVVNSIYAGDRSQGMREMWHEVASYGGGDYSAIDMHCGTVQISTPQDKILIELNMKLNSTYVPYGAAGKVGAANQVQQDQKAEEMGQQTGAGRVAAKATRMYDAAHWDLVDGVAQGKVKVEELKDADLPAAMAALPMEQRQEFVMQQQRARADVQAEIAKVSAERDEVLKKARAEQERAGKTSLDDAMEKSLRKQAEAKGFEFE